MSITDDFILEMITQSVREDTERQNHLGQTHKQKAVSVNAAQQDSDRQDACQMQAEVQANHTAIH